MYRTLVLVLSLVLGSFREAEAQGKGSSDGFKLVDRTGNIIKPRDYRDQYEMLGSWTVLDPKSNQMHSVYASPWRLHSPWRAQFGRKHLDQRSQWWQARFW